MKISVITVNLNNKGGLEETLQSLTSQTRKDFEIIVIDGGSTDGSLNIIQKYSTSITFWVSEKDKGTYHAMNKGIRMASGEYCFFLNSGDSLVNDKVFESLGNEHLWADVVSGNVLKIRSNGKFRRIVPHEVPSLLKLCIHSLPHQASLIRRTLFEEVGFYNESFRIVSDFEFFLKSIVIHKKTYQRIGIDFSFFNLEGISSNPRYFSLAREESYICLRNNFPEMADDLMDYRYFYTSNIGQILLLLRKNRRLYQLVDRLFGFLIKIKKAIAGK